MITPGLSQLLPSDYFRVTRHPPAGASEKLHFQGRPVGCELSGSFEVAASC